MQEKFTLPQFAAMVRRNYAEMTNAARVEFGAVTVEGGSALVQVFFFAQDGSARVFFYSLISEDEKWKIGGVEETDRLPPGPRLRGSHV